MTWQRVVTLRHLASIPPATPAVGTDGDEPLVLALMHLANAHDSEAARHALLQVTRMLGERAHVYGPLLDALIARAQEVSKLRELADRDELTGAANRRAFNDALRRESARCRRTGHSLAVLYVDLDGLKTINDVHGHRAGDEAIRAVADACHEIVRASDLVARLGGDEFAVLLPDVDRKGAEIVRDRLRERIERAVVAGQQLRTSIGLAVMGAQDTMSHETLVAQADAELYRDKQERKSSPDLQAA